MINKSKLALLAGILAVSIASPALAQSANDGQTTAAKLDEVAFVQSDNGGQTTAAKLDEVAFVQSNNGGQTTAAKLDEVAFVTPHAIPMMPRLIAYSDNPGATGGGSYGYNSHLNHDYI